MGALRVSKDQRVGVWPDAWDHSPELKEKSHSIAMLSCSHVGFRGADCCETGRKLDFQKHGDLVRKHHRQSAGVDSRQGPSRQHGEFTLQER